MNSQPSQFSGAESVGTTSENVVVPPNLRQQHHPDCIVCSPDAPYGLRVKYVLEGRLAVGTFDCSSRYEGYPGLLHGGVISALLDGAMTNWLFLHGRVAVTAELLVRFRHPVLLHKPVLLRAWITQDDSPLFRMQSQLMQAGTLKATARAAFMLPRSLPTSAPPEQR